MTHYVDLLPILKKEYEKNEYVDTDDDFLEESVELNEDKIPPQLYQAYKKSNFDISNDFSGSYGPAGQQPSKNLGGLRRNFKWDFGKCYYKELTKQQAVDLLQMKIYDGKTEISINDPAPQNLKVSFEGNAAKENINKLRFLNKTYDGWSLTEFEYRNEDSSGNEVEQFFPIYRASLPSEKFTDLGASPSSSKKQDWDELRINDIAGSKKPRAVYYMIKLADIIYETDEYSHPLDLADVNTNSYNTYNYGVLNNRVNNIFSAYIFDNYIKRLQKRFKDNIQDSDIEFILTDCINKFNYEEETFTAMVKDIFLNKYKLNIDMSTEDFIDIYNSLPEYNYYSYRNMSENVFGRVVDAFSEELQKYDTKIGNWFSSNLKQMLLGELKNSKNYNYDKFVYALQDQFLNKIEDKRVKQVWTRRIKNANPATKRIFHNAGNGQLGAHDVNYTPYNTYNTNRQKITSIVEPDTGNHEINLNYINTDNHDIENKKNNYRNLLRSLKSYKANYINALNTYNKVKSEKIYFDNDEYEEELKRAKALYLDAKANYIGGVNSNGQQVVGIINELKKYKDLFKNDVTATTYTDYTAQKLATLQTNYNKLLHLNNLISQISHYDETKLREIYGFENEKELLEIENKLREIQKRQEEKIKFIRESEEKLQELQRQMDELRNQINTSNTDLDEISKELTKINDEKKSINTGIDKSIIQSYDDQRRAENLYQAIADRVDDIKSKYKKNKKQPTVQPTETDERFLKLIKTFTTTPKADIDDEKPEIDDILTDEDETVEVNAAV